MVAAVTALGACLALPVSAGAEGPQGVIRTFELRIEQRRVPPAQRVLRATEGERVVLHLHGYDIETRVGARHRHSALLHVEIHPR
jgi:hypothetical protein